PLRLNTGRIRDQWHTMTRTGASPRLSRHLPEPFVEINPQDATLYGVEDGGFATVRTQYGDCALRVIVTDRQPPGQIFAPIHWTDETASHARVGAVVAPLVDPHSGQPESKATTAAIAPTKYARQGFLLSRRPIKLPQAIWWARVTLERAYGYRVACDVSDEEWLALLQPFFGEDVITMTDVERGIARGAAFIDGRAEFVWSLDARAPAWEATLKLFSLKQTDRFAFLSGGSLNNEKQSPLVCACFGVREDQIAALVSKGLRAASEIGAACKAGTNCGSCTPEINRVAKRVMAPIAPQA
ncbi:MAG: (2Fe-2S)-binding protein, partial [Methylocystis sp.]|nr:(2Fe-2S)-binding protein [Methylocystis sp.]